MEEIPYLSMLERALSESVIKKKIKIQERFCKKF